MSKENNGWISVEDALPDDEKFCLVCCQGWDIPTIDRYDLDLGDFLDCCEVTHWQPLPEPPKE